MGEHQFTFVFHEETRESMSKYLLNTCPLKASSPDSNLQYFIINWFLLISLHKLHAQFAVFALGSKVKATNQEMYKMIHCGQRENTVRVYAISL